MNDGAPRAGRRLRWIVLAIAAVAGVWIAWHKEIRHHFIPRNFGVVEEGVLYRSGRLTPSATERLHKQYGIKTIIDLGAYDRDPHGQELAERTAAALGITRSEFWLVGDGTGNPNCYVAALRVLADPANHPVLVHCASGAQRTSGLAMLYLKAFHGRPFEETDPVMRAFKHDPEGNPQLMSYLADHGEEILRALRSGGMVGGHRPVAVVPAPAAVVEVEGARRGATPVSRSDARGTGGAGGARGAIAAPAGGVGTEADPVTP